MNRRIFLDGDDTVRAEVFGFNEAHWSPIREKVEDWIGGGWHYWEEEKPEWFTDAFKASVPEYMIPEKEKRRGGVLISPTTKESEAESSVVVVSKRRRSSAVLMAGDGIEKLVSRKKSIAKVAPAGGGGGEAKAKEVDVNEFVREVKRRGSMKL
ncbi:hypothetical protein TrLO_g12689 [Triparma laevis f. longispina]|nr:hypothetical protein TrLO_g12689 [Triparma laevis f. longispina]